MNAETARKLLALNRTFYAAFARPFADSRSVTDPVLTSILPYIPPRARVLDVGCGNGRLAALLDRERPGATCVGIDAAPELIELARAQMQRLAHITAEFHVADIVEPGWVERVANPPYDAVVCLAVLHHLPGFELRARILGEMAALLAPGGCVILSVWQFLDAPRLQRKIAPWSEVDIAVEALEPGDYLLDWRRGGRGLRYVHLVDEAEVERLAAASGLRVRETFRVGGREGNLSLVAIVGAGTLGFSTG